MKIKRTVHSIMFVVTAAALVHGCARQVVPESEPGKRDTKASGATTPATAATAPTASAKPKPDATGGGGDAKKAGADKFTPPSESEIPDNEFGESVRLGKQIFENTQKHAARYVGNGLNCANCHLDNGRRANSAPLWAAYGLYPAYRKKTGEIDTIQSRIQGCFTYSMNGTPPEWDSKEMVALVTYHYWMAKKAPTGVKLPGQGFVKVAKPALTPDLKRGGEVFKNNCAICHGADGSGTKGADGKYAFPPLWGKDSFNWGAGMHKVDTAAGFIKENMPYGQFGTMSDQEAWDVALFMNSHDRPKDPRYEQSLEHTRDKFHDEVCLYHRSPTELMALMDKKAQKEKQEKSEAEAKAKSEKGADGKSPSSRSRDGMSPATAH